VSWSCEQLYTDPYACLVDSFVHAHECIKRRFREKLEAAGWEVAEAEEGYLLKRKPNSQAWFCVHGGTSCRYLTPSLIVIIKTTDPHIPSPHPHYPTTKYPIPCTWIGSIVAIVGRKCYTANVGDSSGLLCSVDQDLSEALIRPVGDSAFPERVLPAFGANGGVPADSTGSAAGVSDCALLITAEHSPESVDEFIRLKR